MRSNGPTMLMLPPFRGVTRRIVLIAGGAFLGIWVLGMLMPEMDATVVNLLMLHPDQVLHLLVWQLLSYPFIAFSLMGVLFSLLSFWMFGAMLEDEFGSLWFGEFFAVATVGGGLLASLLAYVLAGRVPLIDPHQRTSGMWPMVMAELLAFAYFHANEPLRIYFVIPVKAKWLAAAYLFLYLLFTLTGGDRFGALTALCGALSAYVFLRYAPRKGVRFAVSEKWYGLRNAYYRAKRRRAAKKFTVYMKKQGKDVSLDSSGRYVDPSGTPRDPNDKRWMN